jgi:uncharacterized protein YaiL (DUF2058 family)
MGNPFQDQLLKAGLVSKKQAGKAKRQKHLNRKQKKEAPSEVSIQAKKERDVQTQRDRELNRQRAKEKQLHEARAQIRQLIRDNKLERDDFGSAYHFVEENRVQRIFVDDEMEDALSCGAMAIVKYEDGYEVVPAKAAEQIASRGKGVVLAFHKGKK